MRSQLGGIKQIFRFETDLDSQTVTMVVDPELDLTATLDGLAEKSAQMKEWMFQQ